MKNIQYKMKNYHELNFFTNPLKDNFVFPALEQENFDQQKWYLWHYVEDKNLEVVHLDIQHWAAEHKLKINNCHLFCGPPNMNSIIHRDGPPGTNQIGVNWVLSGLDSYMIWYQPNNHDMITQSKKNFSNMEYQQWDDNEVTEIERCQILKPTLINAAIPHRILNNSNQHRWTFSLRFQSSTFSSWQETVNFFKPY